MRSLVLTVIANNFVAPAYENMFGFVCPKTNLTVGEDYALGLDLADYEGHKNKLGRLKS